MMEIFKETILLPLVICVVLPGAAGAWWRHSHGDSPAQGQAVSGLSCAEGTRGMVASTVPLGGR